MIYLVEQLFWFLLLAFVIGLIVGWISFETRDLKR